MRGASILLAEEPLGQAIGPQQPPPLRSPLRGLAAPLERQTAAAGQFLRRLGKRQIVHLLDEAKDVPSRPAGAKTAPEAPFRVNVERGRLFRMKGTQPLEASPRRLERDILRDDLNNVGPLADGLDLVPIVCHASV